MNTLSAKLSLTTSDFIEKSKKIYGDKYDYSKVNYKNSTTKVVIICKEHGEFEQKPVLHTYYKVGCLKCSGHCKYTNEQWIEKAISIHGDKYDYTKVYYKNTKEKVVIICKTHGDFLQTPSDHIYSKSGCPKCSNHYTLTNDEWLAKAKEIHGDKYDYSNVIYIDTKTKVTIICKNHGEFEQNPNSHVGKRQYGCPQCGREIGANKLKLTTDKFLKDAYNIHGDKYDYSKVNCNGHKDKVSIICKKHGEFLQTHNDHIFSKAGCPKCGKESTGKKQTKTHEQFMEEIKTIYGDKYDYSNTKYTKAHNNIDIICKKHGSFYIKACRHLNGQECPKCQLCPSCMLWRTRGDFCEYCKPTTSNKYYYKTKEMNIVKFLKEKLPNKDFIHNKSVGTECTGGHFFPDIRFDCLWFQLIVEVDEHKHRGAGYECDEKRMYDITAKLGQPCIFIRYNPDSKESNKEILLKCIKNYLKLKNEYESLNENENKVHERLKLDNLMGFRAEYLFY